MRGSESTCRAGAYQPEARSAEDWAVKKLGLELRLAREVLSVARALEELPRTDAQLSRGRIAWTAAKWIAEVATAKTERAWLRYARRHTYAELRAAVRKAKGREGARPGDGLDCERAAYAIHLRVPALDHEVFERALKKMLFEIGPRATPREALRRTERGREIRERGRRVLRRALASGAHALA